MQHQLVTRNKTRKNNKAAEDNISMLPHCEFAFMVLTTVMLTTDHVSHNSTNRTHTKYDLYLCVRT